jgi:hypothetical protein
VTIRKHGKKKNDKDEIWHILFKTRYYQSIASCCRLDPPMGCANVSLKYKLNCCRYFPKWMIIAGIRILLSLNIAFTDVSSRYVTLSTCYLDITLNGNTHTEKYTIDRDADLSLFWPPFCFPVAAFTWKCNILMSIFYR